MNATITNKQNRDRMSFGNSVVYVESALNTLVDKEFFNKHKIYNLEFKCNTWNAVKRHVNNYTIVALTSLFPNDTFKFSQKAGCKCGCSPGFRLTHSNASTVGQDIWVDVTYNDDILNRLCDDLAHFEIKLQKEIAASNK